MLIQYINNHFKTTWPECTNYKANTIRMNKSPDWMAPLVGALSSTPKSCRFDSRSEKATN